MSEAASRSDLRGARLIPCRAGLHPGVPTVVDERARRLSHQELAVAELLAGEGHRVASLAERRGRGRQPDLQVCGVAVEVKSFDLLADRGGRVPIAEHLRNKLRSAEGQAPLVIVHGYGSGLTEEVTRAGVEEFARLGTPGEVRGVRVLGDGFDLSWSEGLLWELRHSRSAAPGAGVAWPPSHSGDLRPARRRRERGPELER